jgi:membrane dipeptidase
MTLALTPTETAADDSPEEGPYGVVDLHVDLPWQVHFKGRAAAMGDGEERAEAFRRGGYLALVLPIYLPDKVRPEGPSIADAEAVLATIEGLSRTSPALLPTGSQHAEPGRITTFLAIEGAGAFAKDPAAIDRFIARGVRLIGPAHAASTAFATSATGKDLGYGLSDAGKAFCRRIYEQGALVDVSHLSGRAFADLVPIAKELGAPIVATHSSARALAKSPRNLSDAELRTVAETGGVAGVNFHSPFVSEAEEVTLDDVVLQVEHMVKVAGVEHVAIGSDFDGGIRTPVGLETPASLPSLAKALRKRGFSELDVRKIFGLNALRVLAWRGPVAPKPAP